VLRSRHYYDLYQLANLPEIATFLQSPAYLEVFNDVRQFS
jgi:hypothetical protein